MRTHKAAHRGAPLDTPYIHMQTLDHLDTHREVLGE